MELLNYEEQQFRYKVMNIFFQYAKVALYLTTFSYFALRLMSNFDQNNCNTDQQTFMNIIFNGGVALLLFNVISAAYILCQQHFVRIEFFITFILNLVWFLAIVAYAIKEYLTSNHQCAEVDLIVRVIFYFALISQFDVIVLMVFKHESANRHVNVCSNCIYIILIQTSQIDYTCSGTTQTILIMIVAANVIILVFFLCLNLCFALCNKLQEQLTHTFKFGLLLVLCFQLLNYLTVLFYIQSNEIQEQQKCVSLIFIAKTYVLIVPISILGLIPILYSLNLQKIFDPDEEDDEGLEIQNVNPISLSQKAQVQFPQSINAQIGQKFPNIVIQTPSRVIQGSPYNQFSGSEMNQIKQFKSIDKESFQSYQ